MAKSHLSKEILTCSIKQLYPYCAETEYNSWKQHKKQDKYSI